MPVNIDGPAQDVANLVGLLWLDPAARGKPLQCSVETQGMDLVMRAGGAGASFRGVRRWLEAASWLELVAAATTERYCVVHASAVVWRGRSLVVPGRSMSGKSALCRALVSAGAAYLSDEYALLDENGVVHPYARRPRVRPSGGGVATSELLDKTEFERWPIGTSSPVGAVVGLRYGSPGRAVEASAAEAALLLLDNAVAAQLRPRWAFDHCTASVSGAVAWQGGRADAGATARWVLNELDRRWANPPSGSGGGKP